MLMHPVKKIAEVNALDEKSEKVVNVYHDHADYHRSADTLFEAYEVISSMNSVERKRPDLFYEKWKQSKHAKKSETCVLFFWLLLFISLCHRLFVVV